MKYVVVLGDGMADEPIASLGGRTPLEFADTPTMDALAARGRVGLVQTIAPGMQPGSDTANLAVLGYDSTKAYTGRSPLEALSIGAPMGDTDVAFRCNLVTLSAPEPYEKKTMVDHSAGEISTREAAELIDALRPDLEKDGFRFYVGTSYRHCLIWEHGQVIPLAQPHDILGQEVGAYLPQHPLFRTMQERSYAILENHPVNLRRKSAGERPANSCWFWGAGTRPSLESFASKYHKKGVMISAVDLLKGIAVGIGLCNIQVDGATGGLDTNYAGKAQAAVDALKNGYDFAYIHLEAPDEMGHQGSVEKKIQAIERIDHLVLAPIVAQMAQWGEPYRLLVLPDHATPICKRTHTADPVPYLLYDSRSKACHTWKYNEREARESGNFLAKGHEMMGILFSVEC